MPVNFTNLYSDESAETAQGDTTGTGIVKFSPSTDTSVENYPTRLQSVTAMPEYNTKSFEELHLEDVQAGLKGPTLPKTFLFGGQTKQQKSFYDEPPQQNNILFGGTTQQQNNGLFGGPAQQNKGLFGESTQQKKVSFGGPIRTFSFDNESESVTPKNTLFAPSVFGQPTNGFVIPQNSNTNTISTTSSFGGLNWGTKCGTINWGPSLIKPAVFNANIPFFERGGRNFSRNFSSKNQNITSWCVTDTMLKKDSFKWSINNFQFRSETRGECIKSSEFISGQGSEHEHSWRFDIYPNGFNDSSIDFVGLKINLLNNKDQDKVRVNMNISIVDLFNNPTYTIGEKLMAITIPETGIIFCHDFLSKQKLIKNAYSLLPDGSLCIIFDIYTMTGSSTTKSKKIIQSNSTNDQIHNEISKYLYSEKFSDVIIEVDDSELKAHKLILSTKSSVFSAMFDEENNNNRIKINDMKLDVAKQLLEFIYTNEKPTKINEYTTELMIAAQKYQINGLKIMCEEILFDSISVNNAIKILLIAHQHDMKELKDFVIDFIKSHGVILKSTGFKDLEKERPTLALEVLHEIAIDKTDN